ncbi:GNAT family N-acetyltransferase [Streptomyces sp. NPDC021212]|uniref:GNAT family N-acetyltransferase n=1 Tax=Streptomyces sp. NPDC021212 TaxID=3365118 RepID=UPI0037AE0C58
MIPIRAARPSDAPELVRMRRLMFLAMRGEDEPGPWEARAEEIARRQLSDPEPALGAFVVDGDEPGAPHLAACAVGRMEERLPAPVHPTGRFGFIFNVYTDLRYRHATDDAEELYRSLGFAEHSTALSLDLSGRRG